RPGVQKQFDGAVRLAREGEVVPLAILDRATGQLHATEPALVITDPPVQVSLDDQDADHAEAPGLSEGADRAPIGLGGDPSGQSERSAGSEIELGIIAQLHIVAGAVETNGPTLDPLNPLASLDGGWLLAVLVKRGGALALIEWPIGDQARDG